MSYPEVLTEDQTLDRAVAGQSLSRFGDGELRLVVGGSSISQRKNPLELRGELGRILAKPPCLVCLPHTRGPRATSWAKYCSEKYWRMLDPGAAYGSAFITRPDNAPWIDTDEYWAKARRLWSGRDIVLVRGSDTSLMPDMMRDAKTVREVRGPRVEAYRVINEIEEQIGQPSGTVLLCLGATATVLAARLARKGVHAVDVGHLGMFARRRGLWAA